MATIYDIATLCGTSVATVSYVLNGAGDKKRISKATQEKIMKAAESVNYRPNTAAKRLRTENSNLLSIVLFWPEYYFENALTAALRAVHDVTQTHPDPIEVSVQFFAPDTLQKKWESLNIDAYNGVIVSGASNLDLQFMEKKANIKSTVVINRRPENLPWTTIDNLKAADLAFDTIFARAGDSILAIWEKQFHLATNRRSEEFRRRAAEHGVDMTQRQILADGTSDSGYEAGLKLLHQFELPKAIYCSHEGIARGLSTALCENGIVPGRDTLLLSANLGTPDLCRYTHPSISYIDLKMKPIVEAAIRMCLQLVAHKPVETRLVLQPEIVYLSSFPEY